MAFYGFNKNSVDLVISYLNNRFQSVCSNGSVSSCKLVRHGVPQGSVLGPILFIIYINELPTVIQNICPDAIMYADDLATIVKHKNIDSLQEKVESTSSEIIKWCNINNLRLNNDKTIHLQFNLSSQVSSVKNARFLGINVDSNLGWSSHVDYLASKISKGLFSLRVLSQTIDKSCLISVYYANIHSLLGYGTLLWGNHGTASRLFILQKRAIRIICGVTSRFHTRPLFINLGILTLPSIFVLSCLLYVKNHINNFKICSSVHDYPTRNRFNICINKYKYSKTQNSFQYVSIKLFNSIPLNIRNLNINEFRNKIKCVLINNPLYTIDEFYGLKL